MATLLVVDDDDTDREMVRRCLRDDPELQIVEARDGEAARALLRDDDPPDVVLTDLRMPGLDGLELVRWLSEERPGIPVVLMTSVGNERIAVEALRAGAVNYVPKRDLGELLSDTIFEVLEMAAAHRARGKLSTHHRSTRCEFDLPSDPELIWPLAQYVTEMLERRRFGDETSRSQVCTAVHEALANAVVHGNLEIGTDVRRQDPDAYRRLLEKRSSTPPWANRRVRCVVRIEDGRLECRITDEGSGFTVEDLPDPTRGEQRLAVGGRGVFLMRTFMDEVEYDDGGTAVTLRKRDSTEADGRRAGHGGSEPGAGD